MSEQSPLSTNATVSKRKSSYHGEHHRIRKKGKLLISESVIENETTALVPLHSSDSYVGAHRSCKKYRRERKKPKLGAEYEKRQWNYSTSDFSSCRDRVVFLSYNILGVENAAKHPELYRNVLPKYMRWDHRKKLLRKEIRDYEPGIMCFQEVDQFDDLDHSLKRDGFRGVYKARTGDACDGCAVFWKDKQFSLLREESIEFQSFGLRNNVAQLCVFEMKHNQSISLTNSQAPQSKSSRYFVVGNIHALFNPSRGDIKLGQMRLFLEKAQKLSQEWDSIPVILAGDFNSLPKSAIYQFLASSELDVLLYDRRQISGQIIPSEYLSLQSKNTHVARFSTSKKPFTHRWNHEELRLASGSGDAHLMHQLKLHSAYLGVPASSKTRDNFGEPLATSYHSKFMGTVDYIWHTSEFAPVRVLETLPINILRKTGGLPCKRWGSDHFAVVCELAFIDDNSGYLRCKKPFC